MKDKEYHKQYRISNKDNMKLLSRCNVKKKRLQPLMLKRFERLKDFLFRNGKINEGGNTRCN